MISRIGLHNFKAFDQLQMGLGPITLLLGPNNSGKSSILASLRLLVQTLESYDPQVPLLLNGIMGDFGTYKDIVYLNHRGRPMEISVSIQPTMRRPKPIDSADFWPVAEDDSIEVGLAYKYRTVRRELILKSSEIKRNGSLLLATGYSEDSERQLIEKIGHREVPSPIKSSLARRMRIQNFLVQSVLTGFREDSKGSALSDFLTKEIEDNLRAASLAAREINYRLRMVEYLGAMRVPPSRTYLFTGERRRRVGATGEHAASVLVTDTARSGSRSLNVARLVRNWLHRAGIAQDLRVAPISDRHYEIRVQHPVTREHQNLADVGYGNSQVLPVLVGGFNLEAGATYLVEEPEIHLHPRAQAELGGFFLELYQRGVQSIVETHSEYLVLRLQQYVASREISPDHVRIYYVYAEGEKKKVELLRMDDQGRFVDEWPEGFFPERLEEAKRLSKIRFEKTTAGV
jgi:predicted ATPase